ncbi:MAG: ABC transporter permease [Defluviitaleaceae bacterium]|nr:ABC transporter permease [Defluviitaleaceae bacterium]
MKSDIPKEKFEIIGADESQQELIGRARVSYMKDAWRRLKENKTAMAALVVLCFLILMCIIGPMISGHSFEEINPAHRNQPPSSEHWFGTDRLGRDLFTRVWTGGRVSIIIGVSAALIAAVVGILYGGICAYFGGMVDVIMMRILEIFASVPSLIYVVIFSIVLGNANLTTILVALCVAAWVGPARLVRGQMLQIRNQEFVLAAQALGVSSFKIILKHMVPNTLSVVIVAITFAVPGFIFTEAFLSFIGLGVQPPNTSWGALVAMAQSEFMFFPYQMFFPAIMIALTMLSFTLFGDGLRDALDPRLRK